MTGVAAIAAGWALGTVTMGGDFAGFCGGEVVKDGGDSVLRP
jgi:hypothetical protein